MESVILNQIMIIIIFLKTKKRLGWNFDKKNIQMNYL